MVSHPGPDSSITDENLKNGKLVGRRYRNRRIGEFLKELKFTEGRGTGVPKIYRVLRANGSPDPVFSTDGGRLSFWTQIKIHPAFLEDHGPQKVRVGVHDGVHDGVYDHFSHILSETALSILKLLQEQPANLATILSHLGYSSRARNIRGALNQLIELGLIAYMIADKPRSKKQQYKITEMGKTFLKKHKT